MTGKSIKQKTKAPNWFSVEKYERSKDFSKQDWALALAFRYIGYLILFKPQTWNEIQFELDAIDSQTVKEYIENEYLLIFLDCIKNDPLEIPIDRLLQENSTGKSPMEILLRAFNQTFFESCNNDFIPDLSDYIKNDGHTIIGPAVRKLVIGDVAGSFYSNKGRTKPITKSSWFNEIDPAEDNLNHLFANEHDTLLVIDINQNTQEILKKTEELVKRERAIKKVEEAKKITERNLKMNYRYKILPVLDLKIFGHVSKIHYTNAFFANLLFPLEDITEEQIRKQVMPHIEKMMDKAAIIKSVRL